MDLLVDLGDRIDDRGRDADLQLAREVAEAFRQTSLPREHLMGNHDSYSMSPQDWENILDRPLRFRSCVRGDYRLLFFGANVDNGRGARDYSLQESELAWLEQELGRDGRATIVFTHVPLMAGSMAGHYYFENKPGRCAFLDSPVVRSMLERSGNVELVISGHVHWNSWNCSHGIHYLTLQSLTESFTTGGRPSGAHSIVQMEPQEIRIRVFGADPIEWVLPRRSKDSSWVKPNRG